MLIPRIELVTNLRRKAVIGPALGETPSMAASPPMVFLKVWSWAAKLSSLVIT
jgi:hypothetical protein